MPELGPEERERLKKVLGINTDEALDEWIAEQRAEQNKPADTYGLDAKELDAIQHQTALMQAAWRAADEVVKLPVDHPQMSVDVIWRIQADIAIAIHRGVMGEIGHDEKNPRTV